jgi:UDP-GlcNAc:undecaprenyl-phosphate GlcNAc-1-phosphate transferase
MTYLFLIVFISNILILSKLKQIANYLNIFDKPDNRLKKHKSSVPLLGGIIMVTNFLIIMLILLLTDFDFKIKDLEISNRNYFSIIFFLTSLFLLGLIDDKHKLEPEKKFFLSILFSILTLSMNSDLLITDLSLSFYKHVIFLNEFSFFFTVFCIIILINALNFYDGINGQSIIFFIIIFSFLAYRSPLLNFYLLIIIILIFLLFLNLKNYIFMGDNGIFFTSSILIVALIYEYNVLKTIKYADEILLLLILPGYDLLRLSITRIFRGKNAFYGDRNHIHHLLISKFSLLETNIILILLILVPNILHSVINLNFFIALIAFTTIYILLILKLSTNDKKYYFRKK